MAAATVSGPTPLLSQDYLAGEVSRVERTLHCAMRQICVLNRGMSQLLVRYSRTSAASGRRAHRYHLRLRMAVLEGVRAMYYEYALGQSEELEQLRQALRQASGRGDSDSESDPAEWRLEDGLAEAEDA